MTQTYLDTLTRDAFLGGKIHVLQPKKGFRSGVDAVLLAATVPAVAGDSVLELGCGVGVASLCLHARVPDLLLTGVEVQPEYADLAIKNAASNQAKFDVIAADLRALPPALRQRQFTHVMMNPPYFDRSSGPAAKDAGRNLALAGDTPLADWIETGIRRLAPKGTLTVIQHITRLPEILAPVQARLGGIVIKPITGRAGALPNLFILQARHSGRTPFSLRNQLIMHQGDQHTKDSESYTPQLREILRNGAPLSLLD